MMATFDIITVYGTGDPKLLSGGISEALITTEFGLAVAIPALLWGNVLSGWADRIRAGLEQMALRITLLAHDRRLARTGGSPLVADPDVPAPGTPADAAPFADEPVVLIPAAGGPSASRLAGAPGRHDGELGEVLVFEDRTGTA
jgi:hypothetical protein